MSMQVTLAGVTKAPVRIRHFGTYGHFVKWALRNFVLPGHVDQYAISAGNGDGKDTMRNRRSCDTFSQSHHCTVSIATAGTDRAYTFTVLQPGRCEACTIF